MIKEEIIFNETVLEDGQILIEGGLQFVTRIKGPPIDADFKETVKAEIEFQIYRAIQRKALELFREKRERETYRGAEIVVSSLIKGSGAILITNYDYYEKILNSRRKRIQAYNSK